MPARATMMKKRNGTIVCWASWKRMQVLKRWLVGGNPGKSWPGYWDYKESPESERYHSSGRLELHQLFLPLGIIEDQNEIAVPKMKSRSEPYVEAMLLAIMPENSEDRLRPYGQLLVVIPKNHLHRIAISDLALSIIDCKSPEAYLGPANAQPNNAYIPTSHHKWSFIKLSSK